MCQDFIPFYGRISYLLSFNYHRLPLRKTVLSPLNYKKVFFPSPYPFPLRMITNTWNWHINLSWESLKNIMFMLIPFKVAICCRSAYFQGVFCFFKALLNYTLTSFKCTRQWLYRVMQPLPQSSFRTFLSPQKALSILTSSLRQPVIYYYFSFLKRETRCIYYSWFYRSETQKWRNWCLSSWSHEAEIRVSAFTWRLWGRIFLPAHFSCLQNPFSLRLLVEVPVLLLAVSRGHSVSKRLPHSSIPSLWSSICKASNRAHWSPWFPLSHQPEKLPNFRGLVW